MDTSPVWNTTVTTHEVKALGNIEKADLQLFEYAYKAGAPLAILPDGNQWKVYLSIGAGGYQEKLVRTLDFSSHDPREVAEGLDRYLSFGQQFPLS